MTTDQLTRRRVNDCPESWHVHYDGVLVGVVSERSGNPIETDRWCWSCGFYPGGRPGADRSGTATTFDDALDAFAKVWPSYRDKHTATDFQKNLDWLAHRAEIEAIHARGERLDTERPSSMMTCVCGVRFDSHNPAESYPHRQHLTEAQAR